MGVYIKGMEMPKNCAECPVNMEVCKRGYKYLLEHPELYEKRADDCPIVEVKSSHGDLIDRDALLFDNSEAFHDIDWYTNAAWEAVDNAPTVLEAEGKEDG